METSTLTSPNGKAATSLTSLQSDLEARGVRYAMGCYVDIHGVPKAKAVPISHLEQMMGGSELFTGFALDGLGQGPNEDEIAAAPDPDSLIILPWQKDVAWFSAGNSFHGEPYPLSTRVLLQKQLARAAKLGYGFNVGIEGEIYVLGMDPSGKLFVPNADDNLSKAAYDVHRMLENWPFLDRMVTYMNELGWDVYSFDHEDGHGQYEFDFAYAGALTTADRYIFWRFMAKKVAADLGLIATFMPKPFADQAGTGAHFNMSLCDISHSDSDGGHNLFRDEADPAGLGMSKLGYNFIGGLKAHGRGLMAACAPTVNSYKRLVKRGEMGYYSWAPIFNNLGRNNRSNNYRVPMGGGRVECRGVDAACNPYLVSALMLAAGLDGIERGLEPGEAIADNIYELSKPEREARGIELLPRTLDEALDAFEDDPFFAQVLGEPLANEFVTLKRAEAEEYHNTITEWEVKRYARFF